MFFVVGFVFLFATMIAKIISLRSVITMGKIIGVVGITTMILFLVFFILVIVSAFTLNPGVGIAGDTFCLIIMLCMTIVSFLYLVIDI
ncbi:MAG: hypothetical protein MJ219_00980 [Mycoplasmoidaceae bacterium]|nr:hypothetical protein [Mycoplasmoidaceae bacterium]